MRSLEQADGPELFRLTVAARERLRPWLPWAERIAVPEDTLAFLRQVVARAAAGQGESFGLRCAGALAGVFSLQPQPPSGLALGYWLGEGWEGRGLATAGCRALLGWAFATGTHRVEVAVAAGNVRSRAVAERLGFRLEGVLRQSAPLPGGWSDQCLYALLLEEWPAHRAPGAGTVRRVEPLPAAGIPAAPADAALDAEMAAYYQARAPEYDQRYERRGCYADPARDGQWFRELAQVQAVVRAFAAALPPGAAVLDGGCGTGRWTAALAERRDLTVAGLDRAPAMLEQTRARLQGLGLEAVLVAGDVLALPFAAGTFTAAVSAFVLDHLSGDQRPRLYAEWRRVVRPGGRVLVLDSRREARHASAVEVQTRLLRDGRTFRVRKTLFTAQTLSAVLAPLGPAATAETDTFFVWGEVRL